MAVARRVNPIPPFAVELTDLVHAITGDPWTAEKRRHVAKAIAAQLIERRIPAQASCSGCGDRTLEIVREEARCVQCGTITEISLWRESWEREGR